MKRASQTPTKITLEDRVKDNIFAWFAGALITGYVAGLGTYEFLIKASEQTLILKDKLQDYKDQEKKSKDEAVEFRREIEKLKVDKASVEDENKMLVNNSTITKLFGQNYVAYRSFDLKKQAGVDLSFSQCVNASCITLKYVGTGDDNGKETVKFSLVGPGLASNEVIYSMSAEKGSQFGLRTSIFDYLVVIEDDRISSFRLGVGLREGTGSPDGTPSFSLGGLDDADKPTRSQMPAFLEKWGFNSSNEPFDENDDGVSKYKKAQDLAKESKKHLLLLLGANWSPDCLTVARLMKSDRIQNLLKSFVFISLDVGHFDRNQKIWDFVAKKTYGSTIPIPFFLTIDGESLKVTKGEWLPQPLHSNEAQVFELLQRALASHL